MQILPPPQKNEEEEKATRQWEWVAKFVSTYEDRTRFTLSYSLLCPILYCVLNCVVLSLSPILTVSYSLLCLILSCALFSTVSCSLLCPIHTVSYSLRCLTLYCVVFSTVSYSLLCLTLYCV